MKAVAGLEHQLLMLPKLARDELESTYLRLEGKAAPKRATSELLRMTIGLRLQKLVNARLRARLLEVLRCAEAITPLCIFSVDVPVLVAQWRGTILEFVVLSDGVYSGVARYPTLSVAVSAVTGGKAKAEDLFGPSRKGRNEQ